MDRFFLDQNVDWLISLLCGAWHDTRQLEENYTLLGIIYFIINLGACQAKLGIDKVCLIPENFGKTNSSIYKSAS